MREGESTRIRELHCRRRRRRLLRMWREKASPGVRGRAGRANKKTMGRSRLALGEGTKEGPLSLKWEWRPSEFGRHGQFDEGWCGEGVDRVPPINRWRVRVHLPRGGPLRHSCNATRLELHAHLHPQPDNARLANGRKCDVSIIWSFLGGVSGQVSRQWQVFLIIRYVRKWRARLQPSMRL